MFSFSGLLCLYEMMNIHYLLSSSFHDVCKSHHYAVHLKLIQCCAVSPLPTNVFHSESVFVSPVCSFESNKVSLGTQLTQSAV